jgi:hypothetical protein
MRSTACQLHREALPGRGQTHRQSSRSGLACRLVSGGVEADLVATAVEATESAGAQSQITPPFQQPGSDISERANTLGKSLAIQAAFFQQLEEQMGDLEQVVEDLASGVVLALGMLQIETAIFLDVETFVLHLPP